MDGHRLASVFTGLRLGLHAVVALIVLIVLVRALPAHEPRALLGVAAVLAWTLAYAGGVIDGVRRARANGTSPGPAAGSRRPGVVVGLVVLCGLWAVAAFCLPEASYLVFPLFFLQLHLAGARWGTALVIVSAVVAIIALGVQQGFSVPAAVGPLLGAAVALLIAVGYRSFLRQAQAREVLVAELMSTRDELARSERRAGEEAERTRLAGDIHDTVSQSLSSIQMLLHAAERAPEAEETQELVRLARETAAAAQAETRAIVRALTPPPLETESLGAALGRLLSTEWAGGVPVTLRVSGTEDLDMSRSTAILRLAQGAVGNALRHANASRVVVTVTRTGDAVSLAVQDDGVGFVPESAPGVGSGAGHFGLASMRERVAQFGGELRVDSAPGRGTLISLILPAAQEPEKDTEGGAA